MPQMNPMNWNMIFILNILNFCLFTSFFFFNAFKKKSLTDNSLMEKKKIKIWW